mmetsp:Transcript_4192/g.11587  ORF Transcript_4192/g.11587 Transcript_4192/m.11587 type:complete len:229 (+) Transcript_4192:1345-2031(+)
MAWRVFPKGSRAYHSPPIMNSQTEMGGGSSGSSTQAPNTSSSSPMPRQRRGTRNRAVQRVSGGASRSSWKNWFQSWVSSSSTKFRTPHHFPSSPSSGGALSIAWLFRCCERFSMLWVRALEKAASRRSSARGMVMSKLAISAEYAFLDLLLMSTSMLSVAVARLSAYLAASKVHRMVPVSATRLTELFSVAKNPSSNVLKNPPWLQPPQQGGSFPNFLHTWASSDHST